MESALDLVQSWCISKKQTANPDKTKIVLFSRKKPQSGYKPPKFFGKQIHLSEFVKHLRVYLEPKGYFNLHLKIKIRKAIATLWQCRRSYGISHGLSPKILHWIYTAIVRSRLSYASLIWWPRCRISTVQQQLSKMQRLALTGITGAMKTAPTAALEVIMNIEPLHVHIEAKARSTALKMIKTSTFIETTYGHSTIWSQMTKQNPELEMPCDLIHPTFRFDKSFRVNIPKREDWSSLSNIITENALSWYTDGSRNHLSGAGYYCSQPQHNESIPLGKYASVFQAEVTGILNSCLEIIKRNRFKTPIFICTDSQAAIKSLTKNKITSALILECRDALEMISRQNQTSLVWVPGHSGIEGNEIADELAKTASSTPIMGPEPVIPVSLTTLNRFVSEWKNNKFTTEWRAVGTARQAKNCIKINKSNTKFFLSLSRKHLKRLIDILTGHCRLNNHLHIMGISNTPNCEKCGDVETAEHLLCKCPAYINTRRKILGNFTIKYGSIWSIHPKYILRFLNESGRY